MLPSWKGRCVCDALLKLANVATQSEAGELAPARVHLHASAYFVGLALAFFTFSVFEIIDVFLKIRATAHLNNNANEQRETLRATQQQQMEQRARREAELEEELRMSRQQVLPDIDEDTNPHQQCIT